MSTTSRARVSGQSRLNVGTQRAPKTRNVGNQTRLTREVGPWSVGREPSVDDVVPTSTKSSKNDDGQASITPEKNYVLRPMDPSLADRSDRYLHGEDGRGRIRSRSRDDPTRTPLGDSVDRRDQGQSGKVGQDLWGGKQSTPNDRNMGGIRPLHTPLSMPADSDNQSLGDSRYESRDKRSGDPMGKENESSKSQPGKTYDQPSSFYKNPSDHSRDPLANNKSVTSTPGQERSSALHKRNYLLKPTSNETSSPSIGVKNGDIPPPPKVTTTKKSDPEPSHYSIPLPSPQRDPGKKQPTLEGSPIIGNVINTSRIYVHTLELTEENDPFTSEKSAFDDPSTLKETQSFPAQPLNHNDTGYSQDPSTWV